jgi:hypothetical protein
MAKEPVKKPEVKKEKPKKDFFGSKEFTKAVKKRKQLLDDASAKGPAKKSAVKKTKIA